MTRATLFLLSILAATYGEQINVGLISTAFDVTKITNFEVPKLEQQVPYGNFFENMSRNIQTLLNDVILELYRQVRTESILFGNSVSSAKDQLQNELENTDNPNANYSDHLLKKLNSRLQAYLDLSPGSMSTTYEDLPSLPSQEGNMYTYAGYHPLEDLFGHLGIIVDKHLSNIHLAMDEFYKKGWEKARELLPSLQQQFRNKYLNGDLLREIKTIVQNVGDQSTLVKQRVEPATWQQFEELKSRINTLYNEIKPPSSDTEKS